MLHVVIISPVFAINETDTISVPFLQLYCKELLKRDVVLTIISEQYPTTEDYDWHGARVYTLKKQTHKIPYKFLRKRRLLSTLKKINQAKHIDVIHNFWFNILGEISEVFALKYKIKHITTLGGQDVLPDNKYLKRIDDYSGILVCPSKFSKIKLNENHSATPQIISYGIDPIEKKDTPSTIDIIHCGWINSVKNNLLFLEIVKELQNSNSVSKVVICGGGPMFDELLNAIEKLNLQQLVEIKNSIPRAEVIQLMQESKILVHTSHFESFGLVLAEALACGCKVVSSPVGIAYDDKNIIRCKTKNEFVKSIKSELDKFEEKRNFFNDYPISQTVDGYMEIYASFKTLEI